eukprot:scaffold3744_cov33-Tisochrysis_lutea.AAC.3
MGSGNARPRPLTPSEAASPTWSSSRVPGLPVPLPHAPRAEGALPAKPTGMDRVSRFIFYSTRVVLRTTNSTLEGREERVSPKDT